MFAVVAASLAISVSAAAQTVTCLDPAVPLHQLAHNFEWQPSERAARRAFPALLEYLDAGDPRSNREAALAYRAVLSQDPHDRHAQSALAFLYAAGPDLNYPDADSYRFTRLSGYSNAAARSARMLSDHVAVDSTHWLAAVALTRMALALPNPDRLHQALTAVQHALTADVRHVALLLALRDLFVLQQQYDSAVAVAARIPSDCAPVLHARAEAMILNGDSASGVRLYLTALEAAWPRELHRFEEDAGVTITRRQRAEYRELPPEQRNAWLRAYWEHSAAASGRTIETRITDHLLRAAWANANDRTPLMPPSSNRPISWAADTVHHTPWGPRGLLYMRHGPPHRVYRAEFASTEYEGWVYLVEEQPWTFVFARGVTVSTRSGDPTTAWDGEESAVSTALALEPGMHGWYLLDVAACMNTASFLGSFQPERMSQRLDAGEPLDLRELYVAMSAFDPRYGDMAKYCTVVAAGLPYYPPLAQLIRTWQRENESVHSDLTWRASAVPAFVAQLRVAAAAYEFRDAEQRPEIVAMFWVPAADLAPGTDSATAALRLTYSLTDSIVGSSRTDMTLAVPATLSATGVLSGSTIWRGEHVRSGTLRVVAVDAADTTRGGTAVHHMQLNNDAGTLAISDLVLASPGSAGTLRRGEYSVSPLPGHAAETRASVRVFFELYGVEDSDSLHTSITVRPDRPRSIRESLGLSDDPVRRLSFITEAATDARGVAVQDFDLGGDLEPGRYIVQVDIRVGEHASSRTTTLTVLPPPD